MTHFGGQKERDLKNDKPNTTRRPPQRASRQLACYKQRDENPIRTLGDYTKPSHGGYRTPPSSPKGTMWCLCDSTPSAGSISIWEDLTTRFLAQFFPLRMTVKLRNDILMFQQHQGESFSEAWTRFKDLLQKFSHHGIDLWLQVQIFYDHVTPPQDEPSISRDFAKPVKVISLPQDVPSTSDRRLIELENQVQRLMEAHLAPKQPIQVNKITSSLIAPPTTQTDTTWIPIIAPTIPPSPGYTPASPDYSPAFEAESDPSEDPSSGHIPPLPAVLPFLSSDDDTTDNDTPDTPPSPTHDTPFTEIIASTQRSPVIPSRRVMILAPGQPIPHGRPYRYHPNGPVHMMTARKRVRPLPVQQLSVRHSVDRSSSDSSLIHSSSDYSSLNLSSTSAEPSRKRRRSPMTSVPALPLVSEALSPVRTDLIPSPRGVRDIGYLADVKVGHRETRVERVMHPAMPEDIPELLMREQEQGHMTVEVKSVVTAVTERVVELERDNRRLRGTASVESQRVDRLQRGMSRMQKEMRQMRRFRFYDRVRVGRLEACARKHMSYRL
nr:zinc finger, CCHC-type [Tanacetum cinerariifolium]